MRRKLPTKSVNLLSPIQPPQDTFSMLYDWAFSVGKFLLIFVQIVVIAVFITRLYWDQVNNDLTREINEKAAVLAQEDMQEREVLYRRLHSLFDDLNTLNTSQPRNARTVVVVLENVPRNVYLEDYSFNNGRLSKDFYAHDFADVREYERFLKGHPNHYDVSLELERTGDIDREIEFSVSYMIGEKEED